MDPPIGIWLSDLILRHLDELAAGLTDDARRQIAPYRTMEREVVHTLFVALYRVVAQSFAQEDVTPLRTYLEHVVAGRMRDGASGAGLIQLAGKSQARVLALIERETAADPARRAAAVPVFQAFDDEVRRTLRTLQARLQTHPLPPE